MSNVKTTSKDGRLKVEIQVDDDGKFFIDLMATQVVTHLKASMEQDGLRPVHVLIRGGIEEGFAR